MSTTLSSRTAVSASVGHIGRLSVNLSIVPIPLGATARTSGDPSGNAYPA